MKEEQELTTPNNIILAREVQQVARQLRNLHNVVALWRSTDNYTV